MPPSKPWPNCWNAVLAGSVSYRLVCSLAWVLVMPMSPRRYQPPKSCTGAGAYIGGGGMMEGMSAAKAADDNRDAAPAAMRILTLRIGFVLLPVRRTKPHIEKPTAGRCHQMFKRHLTLIFKVDNL